MPRPRNTARMLALLTGETFYAGAPCKRGHAGERYVSTNACRQCIAGQARPTRRAAMSLETGDSQ